MPIGFFGGTFDPPHRAHAMAVLWALQSGEVERVLIAPMARHPFGKQPLASFQHRLEMCRLMAAEFASGLVEVTEIEDRRAEISYTIDTLRELAKELPGEEFRLLAGSDIAADLPKWREGESLIRLARPLIIPRIAEDSRDPDEGVRPGALPMLSSTRVRELLLARDKSAKDLVPAKVMKYIEQNNLYIA